MRVDEDIRKTVTFLGGMREDGEFIPYGTALLFAVPTEADFGFLYTATAKHVLEGIAASKLLPATRVNRKDGGVAYAKMDAAQWHYHPTIPDLDLAVAPLKASSDIFDIHFCETNKAFLTDEYVRENNIGAGDDVCVVGLLTRHFGRTSNIPIVRYGNIAAMPEEPVDLGPLYGMHHAYLIESRSIGGLSGSPVYLPIPPFRTYNGDIRAMTGHPITLLLGINIGLFETLAHADRIPGESLSERDAFLETMDAGIAVVLPASRLLEIINQPELAEMRKASLEKQQKGTGFKPTSAARARPEVATLAEPEPDNPAHKEDFTALLGEAGQSRSEGD